MSKRLPPGPAANGAGSQTNGKCRIKWIAVSFKPVISNGLKVATIQERENSPSIEMRKKKKKRVFINSAFVQARSLAILTCRGLDW